MKIILISGKSQSGKKTACSFFKMKLQIQKKKVVVIKISDYFNEFINFYLNDKQDFSEYRQFQSEVLARTLSILKDIDYCIIPDFYYFSDYEEITKYNTNVITVRVNRYNKENGIYINPRLSLSQILSKKENELDTFSFNWIIENHTDLNALRMSVNGIVKNIEG